MVEHFFSIQFPSAPSIVLKLKFRPDHHFSIVKTFQLCLSQTFDSRAILTLLGPFAEKRAFFCENGSHLASNAWPLSKVVSVKMAVEKDPLYLHTYYWKEIQMLAGKYLTSMQIDSWWNFSCTYIPMYIFSCHFFRTIFKLHWTDKSYEAQKPLCISSKWWTKCSPHSWVRKMRLQITSTMIWAPRIIVREVMIIWALQGKFWISLKPCTKCWNKPFYSLIALEA